MFAVAMTLMKPRYKKGVFEGHGVRIGYRPVPFELLQATKDAMVDTKRCMVRDYWDLVVGGTPVDSGRARGSWKLGIDFIDDSPPKPRSPYPYGYGEYFKPPHYPKEKESSIDLEANIFITNTVPYIHKIVYAEGGVDMMTAIRWQMTAKYAGDFTVFAPRMHGRMNVRSMHTFERAAQMGVRTMPGFKKWWKGQRIPTPGKLPKGVKPLYGKES